MGKNKNKKKDNTAGGVAPGSVVDEAPMSLGEDQQTASLVSSSDATPSRIQALEDLIELVDSEPTTAALVQPEQGDVVLEKAEKGTEETSMKAEQEITAEAREAAEALEAKEAAEVQSLAEAEARTKMEAAMEEAAKIKAEQEAVNAKAEQEAAEIKAEQEAARQAKADQEAAEIKAEQEAAQATAEQEEEVRADIPEAIQQTVSVPADELAPKPVAGTTEGDPTEEEISVVPAIPEAPQNLSSEEPVLADDDLLLSLLDRYPVASEGRWAHIVADFNQRSQSADHRDQKALKKLAKSLQAL